jgi:hypothetical protein
MAGYLIDISVANLKSVRTKKKFSSNYVFVCFRINKGNGTLGEPGTASW